MSKEKIASREGEPKRIRIIATPSTNGPIPLEIRRHWVGVELDAYSTDKVLATVVKRFPQYKAFYESRKDYFHVSIDDAIEGLEQAQRPEEVIRFWKEMKRVLPRSGLLSFEPSVCIELD